MAVAGSIEQLLAAAPELPWGVGVVASVAGDGTLSVDFHGATLTGLHRLTCYTSPAADDVVLLVHGDGRMVVVCSIA